jgi:hypothetical protein
MIKVRFKRAVTVTGYGSFKAGEEAELSKEDVSKVGAFIDILEKDKKPSIEPSFKKKMSNKDTYIKDYKE